MDEQQGQAQAKGQPIYACPCKLCMRLGYVWRDGGRFLFGAWFHGAMHRAHDTTTLAELVHLTCPERPGASGDEHE